MENNFYVGVVYHGKRIFKNEYREKLVLYSENSFVFLDLLNGITYGIDGSGKDYVLKDSIISTDINEYKIDYKYLLSRYKCGVLTRKRKK